MSTNRSSVFIRLLVAILTISGIASATTITYVIPSGSATADGSVNASAVFVAGPGTLTITLNDLLVNPTSVGELLSNFSFSLSSSLSAPASMSSLARERMVNSDQSFTEGSMVSTGWALQTSAGGGLMICMTCPNNGSSSAVNPPSHLIIGAGAYSNANGSIAGNKPHNPFLDKTATFTISDSTFTSATVPTNVVFGLGTQFGSELSGHLFSSGSGVPETRTMLLIGTGLILLGSVRRIVKT